MRITHNELVLYSGQAVRGVAREWGSVEILANCVADLEILGMSGVRQLSSLLTEIDGEGTARSGDEESAGGQGDVIAAALRETEGNTLRVDFDGRKDVYYYYVLQNYVLESLHPESVLDVRNCVHPQLMAASLLSLKASDINPGIAASTAVFDTRCGMGLHFGYSRDSRHSIDIYDISSLSVDEPRIYLQSGSPSAVPLQSDLIEEMHSHHRRSFSHSDIEQARLNAWDHGVDIAADLWDKIQAFAARTMVPDYAESHARAGE